MCRLTIIFHLEQFGGSFFRTFLVRTEPIQCEAERNPINFDLYKPSWTFSVSVSLAANGAWSHLVSKS